MQKEMKMNYWVFPITADNHLICLKHKVVGAKSNNNNKRINQVKKGDIILFYITREHLTKKGHPVHQFSSVVQCMGPSCQAINESINIFGSTYPQHLPIKIINQKKCDIKPLINKLSFMKNKENWGSAFMSGMRLIPENDYNIIISALNV